jgi:hypothetical protein
MQTSRDISAITMIAWKNVSDYLPAILDQVPSDWPHRPRETLLPFLENRQVPLKRTLVFSLAEHHMLFLSGLPLVKCAFDL